MTAAFYLQIEEDDAFLKVTSSISDGEMGALPHFLDVLNEMLKDEKCLELLEGDWGKVRWREFVSQMDEPVIRRFLKRHSIKVESILLYPLYKVGEDESIGESYPRPECP